MQRHVGGSFAPPITDEVRLRYAELIDVATDPQVQDAGTKLAKMVYKYQKAHKELPDSDGTPHPSGRGVEVALPQEIVQTIWDHVPFQYEIDGIAKVFDTVSAETDKPLRDACFHLLWFANELTRDRQPITTDKI